MNVYLLMEEAGEYEQSDVIGVFSTQEHAEEIQSRLDGEGTVIVPVVVDDPSLKETLFSVNQYTVKIVPSENEVTVTREPFCRYNINTKPSVYSYDNSLVPFVRVYCAAKNEEDAVRVAGEAMDEYMDKKLKFEEWKNSKDVQCNQ